MIENIIKIEEGKKYIVEAGHIYSNEQPTEEHLKGAQIGSYIADELKSAGCEVEKWLLIDDYSPKFKELNGILVVDEYVKILDEHGYDPDIVVFESGLEKEALNSLQHLISTYQSDANGEDMYVLNKGNNHLKDIVSGQLKSALLDACLYVEKLSQSDGCITVLGSQYKTQQEGTMNVLKALGADPSNIQPVFYD